MGNTFYFEWEVSLMEWLQSHIPSAGISVISALSMFGEELLMVAVMGFIYWGLNKEFGKYVGLNVLTANVWNPMIKNVFLRRRPYFDNEGIKILRIVDKNADIYDISAQGYSFPSGHSTGSAALYGSMARFLKKRLFTILAFLLPLLVGFSRVVVGAHYPTDVLVGWCVGTVAIFLLPALNKLIKKRWMFYGLILITTLPGLFYCTSTDYFSGLGMLIGFFVAVPFEEKFVNFENTKSIPRMILRTVGGGAVFFGLNTVLKLPFPSAFLSSGTLPSLLVRTVRYFIVCFVDFSIYPMLFKYTAKIGKK